MKRRTYLFPLMAATALSLTLAACGDDNAQDNQAPADQTSTLPVPQEVPMEEMTMPEVDTPAAAVIAPIDAENATAYATAPGARSAVVFVTLTNPNAAAHSLTGARTDRAAIVEIHQNVINDADGTVQMRRVESLEIDPGVRLELEANGYHIMLIDLASPLVEGETFDITLEFGGAGELSVPVSVVAPGGMQTAPAAQDGMPNEEAPDIQDEPSVTDEAPEAEADDADSGSFTDGAVTEQPALEDEPAAE